MHICWRLKTQLFVRQKNVQFLNNLHLKWMMTILKRENQTEAHKKTLTKKNALTIYFVIKVFLYICYEISSGQRY